MDLMIAIIALRLLAPAEAAAQADSNQGITIDLSSILVERHTTAGPAQDEDGIRNGPRVAESDPRALELLSQVGLKETGDGTLYIEFEWICDDHVWQEHQTGKASYFEVAGQERRVYFDGPVQEAWVIKKNECLWYSGRETCIYINQETNLSDEVFDKFRWFVVELARGIDVRQWSQWTTVTLASENDSQIVFRFEGRENGRFKERTTKQFFEAYCLALRFLPFASMADINFIGTDIELVASAKTKEVESVRINYSKTETDTFIPKTITVDRKGIETSLASPPEIPKGWEVMRFPEAAVKEEK